MLALTNSFAHGATRPQARAVQRKAINATGAARPVLMATRAPRSVQMRAVSTEVETKKSKKKDDEEKEEKEDVLEGPDAVVTTGDVRALLDTLCGETNVAKLELKLPGFSLKVVRSVEEAAPPPPPPSAAPAAAAAAPPTTAIASVVTPAALASLSPDESIDEALLYVTSPKVGVLRRGKYAAGKRVGSDFMVKDGDTVRANQTVAYVEQLGTYVEIKTPTGGEVARFKAADGEPVEYGQVVLELAPTFGSASPSS